MKNIFTSEARHQWFMAFTRELAKRRITLKTVSAELGTTSSYLSSIKAGTRGATITLLERIMEQYPWTRDMDVDGADSAISTTREEHRVAIVTYDDHGRVVSVVLR